MRLWISFALLLGGCTSLGVPQEVQAVRDLVAVSKLEQVDTIRLYRQLFYSYVNDYFVTVSVGERHYLVEFASRCSALTSSTFTPSMVDFRYDPSYLRVRDTIKGCPVGRIYEATAGQLHEIKAVSDGQATGTIVPEDG